MSKILSFDEIAAEILKNKKFLKLDEESHHGITRMEHSMRVARNVYKYSLKFNLDYVSATRAAILHDFFVVDDFKENLGLIQGVVHPNIALANAKGEFKLNKKEENAIVSHMFPLNMTLPKYKESWLLTIIDKIVAIYEYGTEKWSYTNITSKLRKSITLYAIFLFNLLTMGER